MDQYLLDSSAIIDLLKGGQKANDIQHLIQGGKLLTSIICYCEVLNQSEGARQSAAKALLSSFLILPLTITDGHAAEKIQYACRKSGEHVRTMDCLIAATALTHEASVVATDDDFKRIEGVKSHIF